VSPADEDDEVLLILFGWHYNQIDPRSPLSLGAGAPEASYGMNGIIEPENWGPRQVMVMDANRTVIDVGTTNYEDDLESVVQPRHFRKRPDDPYSGKVNVVTCDGSVRPWTLGELRREYEKADRGRWGPR
jgi:prepilin-type processing-associated H-X9-DG protein